MKDRGREIRLLQPRHGKRQNHPSVIRPPLTLGPNFGEAGYCECPVCLARSTAFTTRKLMQGSHSRSLGQLRGLFNRLLPDFSAILHDDPQPCLLSIRQLNRLLVHGFRSTVLCPASQIHTLKPSLEVFDIRIQWPLTAKTLVLADPTR